MYIVGYMDLKRRSLIENFYYAFTYSILRIYAFLRIFSHSIYLVNAIISFIRSFIRLFIHSFMHIGLRLFFPGCFFVSFFISSLCHPCTVFSFHPFVLFLLYDCSCPMPVSFVITQDNASIQL